MAEKIDVISLSEEDRKKITNYIDEKTSCSHENCTVLQNVFSLSAVQSASIKKASYPVVVFWCQDCGFVRLYDIGKLKQSLDLTLEVEQVFV